MPVGVLAIIGMLSSHVPEHVPKPGWRVVFRYPVKEFDLPGFILFGPAAIQLFIALQLGGNQYAWNSSTVIGLFCGAGVMFIIWLIWDYHRGDEAMVPFSSKLLLPLFYGLFSRISSFSTKKCPRVTCRCSQLVLARDNC